MGNQTASNKDSNGKLKSSITIKNFSEDKIDNSINKENIYKIRTLFEWYEGGETVLLSGSFAQWNHLFAMTKNKDKFELYLVKFIKLRIFLLEYISISLL